jgi:putative tryptophan/tyrosine transport system substrate-binding protein
MNKARPARLFRRLSLGVHMQRREFIAGLGAAGMAASSNAARAQQPGRLPIIGYLGPSSPENTGPSTAAFLQRLRDLGWLEGRTVTIAHRWAEGRPERVAEIAAEFVRLQVDIIVTTASNDAIAMKQVTSTIPIVFAVSGDPVGTGLVATLARPGGNITGLSVQSPETSGKRLELLREVVPGLHRLAILANPDSPNVRLDIPEVQAGARRLGVDTATFEIRRAEDIVSAFEALKSWADALYVVTDPLVSTNRIRVNALALEARLPTIYGFREAVESGGLMSYGPNFPDLYRRTAEFVDQILRGTRPADIPVEQPTRFDLVVNLTTAKALGLTIPETFLVRADKVIE